MKSIRIFALTVSIAAAAFAQEAKVITPTVSKARAAGVVNGANPTIVYHGGPVLGSVPKEPVHIYYIFYGGWATLDPGGPQIMTNFLNGLGGSAYWNILTTYVEPSKTRIYNQVTLAGTTTDNYSQGKQLNDTTLQTVVKTAISNGSLPLDSNAVYEVLTTSDVNETSGWCTSYCGFHTHMTYESTDVKYAFIGDPIGCTQEGGVADCQGEASNISQSPNNDPGVDAMISVIAHESEEATSDPDLNAWYFNTGYENADECAYTYGSKFVTLANGSKANIVLDGNKFLIQQNYVAPSGGCAMSYTRK